MKSKSSIRLLVHCIFSLTAFLIAFQTQHPGSTPGEIYVCVPADTAVIFLPPDTAAVADTLQRSPGFQPLSPEERNVVFHGSRDRKLIALTFDACSTERPSGYDRRIPEILISHKTAATLFLGGKWMREFPSETKFLASDSLFEIGNHSLLHPHLTEADTKRIHFELRMTQQILDSLTGKRATVFRSPYGEYDDRVVAAAADLGMRTIQYDLPSGDPDLHLPADRLLHEVLHRAINGSIIVMHMNRPDFHTAEILPLIIEQLRKRGYSFVTIDQLLSLTRQPIDMGK
jgi:peptidoglycan/xylan/chitin deacetylase (PgdA/CDA1 family)